MNPLVLVKNEKNILPLSKDSKVLVTGPTADMLSVMNGGWTITWQGSEESLYPNYRNTVLKAITKKLKKGNVTYVKGSDFSSEINIKEVVESTKNVDAVIYMPGRKSIL